MDVTLCFVFIIVLLIVFDVIAPRYIVCLMFGFGFIELLFVCFYLVLLDFDLMVTCLLFVIWFGLMVVMFV